MQVSTEDDAFSSEREMLLAAVASLREAAEAAMRRAEAAEAACFAPMKLVLEAHLKEYKEHVTSEIRSALQQEVSEATAELRATAHELRMLWSRSSCTKEADVTVEGLGLACRQSAKADFAQPSRLELQHQTLPSLSFAGENLEVKRGSSGTGSKVLTSTPEMSFAVSSCDATPARIRSAQEETSTYNEVGSADEEDTEGRRRSVRDVVSHFEKVSRSPFSVGTTNMSEGSGGDRLVPTFAEEVGGRSQSHGLPHEGGRSFQLPGLTPHASREDLNVTHHTNILRRKSV